VDDPVVPFCLIFMVEHDLSVLVSYAHLSLPIVAFFFYFSHSLVFFLVSHLFSDF